MDLKTWQINVRERLTAAGDILRESGPGMVYGALSTLSILPLVSAVNQGEYGALFTLSNIVGSIGGNLIANQLQNWKDRNEQELAAELAQQAAADPEWRAALDKLQAALETPRLAQAILSEAGWDRLTALRQADFEQFAALVQQELQAVERGHSAGRDLVAGDIGNNAHMAAIGKDIEQRSIQTEVYNERPTFVTGPLPADTGKLTQRYFQRLRNHCHALPLTAMGSEATAGDEITLDKVYIELDTTSQVKVRQKIKRNKLGGDDEYALAALESETEVLTALQAATQTRRLVLLGHPGGGKSTFVRQLIARLISAKLERTAPLQGWSPELFPLLTVLRELAPHLEALTYQGLSDDQRDELLVACVKAQWQTDLVRFGGADLGEPLEEALLAGKALLVFDGLDEMAAATRPRVQLALAALLKAYPDVAHLIVTCRIRSYTGDATLPGFTPHTLAPFTQKQSDAFVTAWYNAQVQLGRLVGDQAQHQIDDLQRATHQEALRSMAANPMLLTTMAIIHQKQTRLPEQRVCLYTEAVNVLLNRWQESKGAVLSAPLKAFLNDKGRVRPLLERIAHVAHSRKSQEVADLKWSELLELCEQQMAGDWNLANEFLNYIDHRAGLLIGQGGDERHQRPQTYTFPHRTFQEYLAGCRLLEGEGNNRGIDRTYLALAEEGEYWQLAAQLGAEELLYNRSGTGTLLDLMYALCPVTKPRNKRAWRATLWSGQMAALLGRKVIEQDQLKADAGGGPAYLKRLIPRLLELMRGNHLPAIERAEAGRTLAKLGDPRPAVLTTAGMEFCYVPAGPFVMGSRKEEDDLAQSNEQPQHTFDIPYAYWISRYPVTNAQFAEFVEAGGYANPVWWVEARKHGYWSSEGFKGYNDKEPRQQPYNFGEPFTLSNHPVVGVSWYEALAFTLWLTEQWASPQPSYRGTTPQPPYRGTTPQPPYTGARGWQVRLPSEAEWEKAARGGLLIPVQRVIATYSTITGQAAPSVTLQDNPLPKRRYAWGHEIDPNRMNFGQTNINSTSAVGCFPGGVTVYGVEEMNGTVWEWCRTQWVDNYEDYANRENNIIKDGVSRLLRGGGWVNNSHYVRAAFRNNYNPPSRDGSIGFRLVASPGF